MGLSVPLRVLGHDPDGTPWEEMTAHRHAAERLAPEVDTLWCANLRGGRSFAVADAYRDWRDVSEEEALDLLRRHRADAP